MVPWSTPSPPCTLWSRSRWLQAFTWTAPNSGCGWPRISLVEHGLSVDSATAVVKHECGRSVRLHGVPKTPYSAAETNLGLMCGQPCRNPKNPSRRLLLVMQEALDPEAAALLELLDAEWRAAEAAAGGAPAAAAVGPSGTPGGSKPAAAARRPFAGGGRGHALVSPLRRVAQHAAGSGAARSAPGAPAPAAAAGGRRLVGSKRPAAADGFEVSPPPPQQQAGAAASQPPLGAQPTPQRPLKRRALTQPLQDGF